MNSDKSKKKAKKRGRKRASLEPVKSISTSDSPRIRSKDSHSVSSTGSEIHEVQPTGLQRHHGRGHQDKLATPPLNVHSDDAAVGPAQSESISKYFGNGRVRIQGSDSGIQGRPQLSSQMPSSNDPQKSLGSTFISIEGRHRGVLSDSDSPDELAGETTIGAMASKPARSHKPTLSGHLQNAQGEVDNQRLQVRPSSKKPSRTRQHATEAPAAWAVAVEKVFIPRGEDVVASHSELALQYDEDDDSYDLIFEGKPLSCIGVSGQIRCKKIQKIIHAFDGNLIRFECSLSEGIDNKLDLILKRRGDLTKLIQHLKQGHPHLQYIEKARFVYHPSSRPDDRFADFETAPTWKECFFAGLQS